MTSERGPRRLRLPDGRRLAFAEHGDSDGRAVVYCHGFPSSHREAELIGPGARAEGVRIIAPDRPGYGDSDPLPQRSIAGWAEDVAALADHLGLGHFALVGVSGGGPYALACAQHLPERIQACALVCPLGPIYRPEVLAAMHPAIRASFLLPRRAPRLARLLLARPATELLSLWPEAIERLRSLHAPPADRDALARPEVSRTLNGSIRDAMRGGALGALDDLVLYTGDWGLDFGALTLPIDLWHGEADGTVPVAHARWYAARLPNAHPHLLAGEGHFSLPLRHSRVILHTLLTRYAARPPVPGDGVSAIGSLGEATKTAGTRALTGNTREMPAARHYDESRAQRAPSPPRPLGEGRGEGNDGGPRNAGTESPPAPWSDTADPAPGPPTAHTGMRA